MFARLGSVVSRHWVLVIVAWIVLAAVLRLTAPSWDEVANDGDLAYLPTELPSIRGTELLKRAFPRTRSKSQIVLVVARQDGILVAEDYALADRLTARFHRLQEEGQLPIVDIWTRDLPALGSMLRSRDGRAILVVLHLSHEFMSIDNIRLLARVEQELDAMRAAAPAGLELGVTGSAAIGGDMLTSARDSLRNTEVYTILLVILILLLVYRAPLLVVVPLAAIWISFSVATHLIPILTQLHQLRGFEWWNFKIFTTTKIFIVVILFGAGTDYCLFLIARYKEELIAGFEPPAAVARSIGAVGRALAASALTTIVGLGMMYFADFGKFSNSGPAIALCLVVATLACVTVAPAILAGIGRGVFWPLAIRREQDPPAAGLAAGLGRRMDRFWEWTSRAILARPGMILGGSLLVMAPFAWEGLSVNVTYDLLGELERGRPSVRGTALLGQHFPPGETSPLTVLIYQPQGQFETERGEQAIARLTKFVFDQQGVEGVRSLAEPLGGEPGSVQPFTRAGLAKLAAKRHPITRATFVTQVPELRGRVARLDVILSYDPFSREAIEELDRIEGSLTKAGRVDPLFGDAEFYFTGTTAGIRDLKNVTGSDQRLIKQLVVIAVLAVLLVLLRHPGICVYLILSVLWSYFVTIGGTELFFQWLYGPTYDGLDWKVPLFLFVILIAVGEDYNIYLVTRVLEEQQRRGAREGLRVAVVRTGGIITSCGVIMAGTFVSMMTGALRGMLELGFALSVGVLLDTFVVRTILVSAFLAIVARRKGRRPPSQAGAASAVEDPVPAKR